MPTQTTPDLQTLMGHVTINYQLDAEGLCSDSGEDSNTFARRQQEELQYQAAELCAAAGRVASQIGYSHRYGCIGSIGKVQGEAVELFMRSLCLAKIAGLTPENIVTRIEAVTGLRIGEVEETDESCPVTE